MKNLVGMTVMMLALLLAACQPIMPVVESGPNQIDLNDLATALAILDNAETGVEEYELLIRFFFSCFDGVLFDAYEPDTLNEMTGAQVDALKYVFLGAFVTAAQFDSTITTDGEYESSVEVEQDEEPFSDQIEAATKMCQRVLDEAAPPAE